MEIEKIANEIHKINCEKGFWDEGNKRNVGELLMLCVSELSEALEAHRDNHFCNISKNEKSEALFASEHDYKNWFEANVKNTFEDEMADSIIRLLDLSIGMDIDLVWHLQSKIKYNKLRKHKHGKSY